MKRSSPGKKSLSRNFFNSFGSNVLNLAIGNRWEVLVLCLAHPFVSIGLIALGYKLARHKPHSLSFYRII